MKEKTFKRITNGLQKKSPCLGLSGHKKTFITLRVKNRKRRLDFNGNKIYIRGDVGLVNNRTKGILHTKSNVVRGFSKLRLLFKMLKAKNFVFAEVK